MSPAEAMALLRGLDAGADVSVTVHRPHPAPSAEARGADLSASMIAAITGRALSTVRGWFAAGLIPEAYKVGRESWTTAAGWERAKREGLLAGRRKPRPVEAGSGAVASAAAPKRPATARRSGAVRGRRDAAEWRTVAR